MAVALEPFPLFIDSAPPEAASYFSRGTMSKQHQQHQQHQQFQQGGLFSSSPLPCMSSSAISSSPFPLPSGTGSGVLKFSGKAARTSIASKLTANIRLRYYQYELTFGLYVMTPMEKVVLNSIVLIILSAITYALYWGLEPFVIRSICRFVYYITGTATLKNVPELCT